MKRESRASRRADRRRGAALPLVLVLSAGCLSGALANPAAPPVPAAAAPAAPREPAAATGGELLAGLRRLAAARGVSFVLEGDASRAREMAEPAPTGGADAKPGLPGLEALAGRFDYSVEAVRGLDRVYVLKTATPPGTAPDATRRIERIREEAAGRLRHAVAEDLPHYRLTAVPLAGCMEEARRAFAVAYLLSNLQRMEKVVARPAPGTIARIGELHISGGPSEGGDIPMFGLVFSVPRGDGKGGFSGDTSILMRHPLPPGMGGRSRPQTRP